MGKDQKGFVVYGDIQPIMDRLTDEEAGQLLKGMVKYFNDGTEPKFNGILEFVWIPIQQQMDRNTEKYKETCEKNRKKIQDYWDKVKGNTTEYSGIQRNTTATNTKTKTDTDRNTGTETDTESVPDAGLLSFDLISYLNDKTGSEYKSDRANANRIQSLLDAGYTPYQLRSVVDKKVADWFGDDKMRSYLRPSTLWGDKFSEYLAAPISLSAEKQKKAEDDRASLERTLAEKRQALADLNEDLATADKTERRTLREQIAILEDSISLIEGRLA